jgi:hypothetical protein
MLKFMTDLERYITEALVRYNERQNVRCKSSISVEDGSFAGCKSLITLSVQNYIRDVYDPIQSEFDEADIEDEKEQRILLLERLLMALTEKHGKLLPSGKHGIEVDSITMHKVVGKTATIENSDKRTYIEI